MSTQAALSYISFLKQNRTAEQADAIYRQRIADALLVYESSRGIS